ncbi:hypothetical protein [Aliikangiella coralliicola]|uniref:Uncharacterized protein n=1 Tax=Aliikangiella coralliicola TaxID=2592383 RepID=A0A545U0D3_9GAMM|nr:hypothetical protein [Aliikangiella coralliicola]TQV82926.1 hypothetical protein FLL46_24460 [Aliikangiella coralliicola]
MNSFTKLVGSLSFLTVSTISSAAGSYSHDQEIKQIQLYEGHTGVLIKQTDMVDPDNCGRNDYYILPETRTMFKEAYSTVLAAYHSGSKIKFWIDGCHEGIPKIKHIYLIK